MLFLSGEFTDLLRGAEGAGAAFPTRPNLVVARALDLVAALLARRPGIAGLLYWAVGAGDPAWDTLAAPPAPDRRAATLVKEVYRKRLAPGDFTYDPAARALTVRVTFLPGEATADLREFGLFGGDASGLPDSGFLFNTARHAVVHKAAGQSLDRTLKLTLAGDSVLSGLLDTIGQLLANVSGVTGVTTVAFGSGDPSWDQHPPAPDPARTALQQELIRTPLDPIPDIEVVPYQQALVAHAVLEYNQAATSLREAGLFGGSAAAPVLLDHVAFPAIDHSVAARLRFDVRMAIGIDPAVAVPDVTTKTLADAAAALAAAGLRVGDVRAEEHPGGNNTVLRQVPAPGAKAVDGASVQLTLTVPVSIPAPRLIGLTTAAAAPVAAALGLTIAAGQPPVESPQTPGTIVSQAPAAGDLIRPGNSIQVILATPETTLVPDIAGLRPGEAAALLAAARLTLSAPPFPTVETTLNWGTIVSQNPAAGSRQIVNSGVTPTLAVPPTVAVPNLVNSALAGASAALRDAAAAVLAAGGLPPEPPGLAIGQVTYVENAAAPGTILSQTPAAAQKTVLFGTVDIAVASPVTVAVPALAGLAQANAAAALRNAGLLPGAAAGRIDPAPPGTVLAQDPPAGSRVALGSIVSFTVATPIQVAVPALIGRSVDFAREALAGSRLTLGAVNRVPTTAAPVGSITAQDQPAGKLVALLSTVNITIAGNTVQVPSLAGQSVAAATALLAGVGLTLAVGAQVESSAVAPGLIAGQSPAANTVAPVGSAVTVNLAIPPRVTVPNLVGRTLQDAQTLAAVARFTLVVSGQAESDQPPGTVAVQSPVAGQPAAPGSAITVQTAVPRSIAVPNLIGLALAAAQQQAAGLTVTVSQSILSDAAAGIVLQQNPAAGVKVAPRSTVTVVTSAGIGVRVPSVLRLTLAVATQVLRRGGFGVSSESIPSTLPLGTVINQSPAAGALVASGTTVELTVSGARRVPINTILTDRPFLNQILKTPSS
ncbi:MAG: PASTA domain-containing protein [Acidobacteria bacterium]|nr:PASTA domain-containing protein [Acidobacteriota bacterium]